MDIHIGNIESYCLDTLLENVDNREKFEEFGDLEKSGKLEKSERSEKSENSKKGGKPEVRKRETYRVRKIWKIWDSFKNQVITVIWDYEKIRLSISRSKRSKSFRAVFVASSYRRRKRFTIVFRARRVRLVVRIQDAEESLSDAK